MTGIRSGYVEPNPRHRTAAAVRTAATGGLLDAPYRMSRTDTTVARRPGRSHIGTW
jgi:hypothetical protein